MQAPHRAPPPRVASRLQHLVPRIVAVRQDNRDAPDAIGVRLDEHLRPRPAASELVVRSYEGRARLLVTVDDAGNGPRTSSGVGTSMREFAEGIGHFVVTAREIVGTVVDGTSALGRLGWPGMAIALAWDLVDVHSIACSAITGSEEVTIMCVEPDAALELRAGSPSPSDPLSYADLDGFAAEVAACAARRLLVRHHDNDAATADAARTVVMGAAANGRIG